MTEIVLTGLSIAALVVVLICTHLGRRSHISQGPDVGLAVFAEDGTDDDYDYGCPMVVDEQAEAGIDLAYYGTRVVHRQCLIARRDGRDPCADCAKILAAVTL